MIAGFKSCLRNMPQLILGVHSGSHDAAAAVFEDYSLKAAVHLERLTRRKSDGSRHPDAAINEVLSIAGATRRDVDVVTYSRGMFPTRYFRHLHGAEWLREQYRTYFRRRPRRQLMPELFRHQTTDVRSFLDIDSFQREQRLPPRLRHSLLQSPRRACAACALLQSLGQRADRHRGRWRRQRTLQPPAFYRGQAHVPLRRRRGRSASTR